MVQSYTMALPRGWALRRPHKEPLGVPYMFLALSIEFIALSKVPL